MKQERWLLFAFIIILLASFGTAPAIAADEDEDKDKKCDIPFVPVLYKSGYSLFDEEDFFVIESEDDWCDFWFLLYPGQSECDTSGIDFENEAAIAVALGELPNTCYSAEIVCIYNWPYKDKERTVVEFVEVQPAPACICGQMIVQPVHVVKIKKEHAEEVMFEHIIWVLYCPVVEP